MGRPRKEIDFKLFEDLCKIQCTLTEIAGIFKVSEDTIENRCKEQYDLTFSETYKIYSADGKMSLRRKQFHVALDGKGNVGMLIWLGKQYLNQKDRSEIDTNEIKPITLNYALNKVADEINEFVTDKQIEKDLSNGMDNKCS